jgi:hypothetical protein
MVSEPKKLKTGMLLALSGVVGCGVGLILSGWLSAVSNAWDNAFDMCVDTVKAEAKSPDGLHIATSFERNCGATTGYSTMVVLRRHSGKLDLRHDTDPQQDKNIVLIVDKRPNLQIRWKSNRELLIDSSSSSIKPQDIFKKNMSWNNIQIQYNRKLQ